jgi:hypothetical protein
MDTLTAIHRLKDLEPDWDSYGAVAPDEPTVERAVAYLRDVIKVLGNAYAQPEVRAIPDPGVSLTWRGRSYDAEVKLLVTPTVVEWVQLKNRHIVDQGAITGAAGEFHRFTHSLSSVKL